MILKWCKFSNYFLIISLPRITKSHGKTKFCSLPATGHSAASLSVGVFAVAAAAITAVYVWIAAASGAVEAFASFDGSVASAVLDASIAGVEAYWDLAEEETDLVAGYSLHFETTRSSYLPNLDRQANKYKREIMRIMGSN